MADALIITRLADEFAAEIERLAETPIEIIACPNAEAGADAYAGEKILFGNPAEIAAVLPAMPNVEWVQSSWAGVTPLIELDKRDYTLTGIKDVFGPQMSEYVFGYLLAHELRIQRRHDEQKKRHWFREHSGVLEKKTLAIMGTGSIGWHIAKTAQAFDMRVIGLSRSGEATPEFDDVYPANRLDEFLTQANYLVSTLPDTRETDNLLNANTLASLPEHAFFINVGRSNVVDDTALMQALRTGRLSGAALDVFDTEPVPSDSSLWNTPNLFITAHIAAISHPLLIVPVFVENYRLFREGQPLKHVVDFDAGY